jgi:PPM family protein phosphatase
MKGKADADTVEDAPEPEDPFSRQFGPRPPPVAVKFGTVTQPGNTRPINEDHHVVIERRRSRSVLHTNLPSGFLPNTDDTAYIMAVADGMGGAAFGELASKLALRSGWDVQPHEIKWTWIVNDREIEDFKERVAVIFYRMDQAILDRGRKDPACKGMGTTMTGAYTVGPEAFVAHVGDSRAYLYHAGKLSRLTRDHTVAQHYMDMGLPVESRSWRHQLTNVLGGDDRQVYVEFHHFHLEDGDKLLLCTNGLTDQVDDDEIASFVSPRADPQAIAQALVNLALDRQGEDDVTVILAEYAMLQRKKAKK